MIHESLLSYPTLPTPVVKEGEFPFAAIGLAHSHIGMMCEGLRAAGGTPTWVYDKDPDLLSAFVKRFPFFKAARCEEEILEDPRVRLVASADIPSLRCPLGLRVMAHGKDFFSDKAPMISLDQLAKARAAVKATGRKYAVLYGERCANESAVYAGLLIKRGAVGKVLNIVSTGPHNLYGTRPDWFYKRATQGGILIDIGSHHGEQFLYYTGNKSATITAARIANYAHGVHPEFDDFGDVMLTGENGATGYFRVDWFTPDAVPAFGDGRTFILGDEGYIELRKYVDPMAGAGDTVVIANRDGMEKRCVRGKIGLPFYGQLIRDCLDGTETAMTAEHAFMAAELSIRAQMMATDVSQRPKSALFDL